MLWVDISKLNRVYLLCLFYDCLLNVLVLDQTVTSTPGLLFFYSLEPELHCPFEWQRFHFLEIAAIFCLKGGELMGAILNKKNKGSNKIFTTLGATNHSEGDHQKDDYYATAPIPAVNP